MASDSPLVLVVDDSDSIRLMTRIALLANHFRVIEAANGQNALDEVASQHPDVILLDLGLPDMSGIEVIHRLSDAPNPPILVFSARGSVHDEIEALDAGAVDYLAKPFRVPDLILRLRSALKFRERAAMRFASHFKFGDLEMDLPTAHVEISDQELSLTDSEFRLLTVFAKNAGRLLTHHFLIHEMVGATETSETADLATVVAQLRNKLEPDVVHPHYLFAVPGIGYRFRDE